MLTERDEESRGRCRPALALCPANPAYPLNDGGMVGVPSLLDSLALRVDSARSSTELVTLLTVTCSVCWWGGWMLEESGSTRTAPELRLWSLQAPAMTPLRLLGMVVCPVFRC